MSSESHDLLVIDSDALTSREAEVLLWTAEGKTAWEIGAILGISEGTVRAHLAHILEKLKASNKPHAVSRAFVIGIIVVKNTLAILFVCWIIGTCDNQDEIRIRSPQRRAECRPTLTAGSRCRL